MDASQHTPAFVLPPGTQVVLRRDLLAAGPEGAAPEGRPVLKRGSVGVVARAPATNEYTYIIRFVDGSMVHARRTDLSIRREEAPEADLPGREIAAFEPHLIYRVRVGSRAFGLADANSDEDERGVYLPPAEWHWSLQAPPEQIEFKRASDGTILGHDSPEGEADVCWWELGKFLRLAIKANPNILETLYVPEEHVLFADAIGRRLRELREKFLSKLIYQT